MMKKKKIEIEINKALMGNANSQKESVGEILLSYVPSIQFDFFIHKTYVRKRHTRRRDRERTNE